MSDFIPPRMEHVIIDEETQMQKYLAEIAMEDILLMSGSRTVRPDGLMAKYRRRVARDHADEAANEVATIEEITIEEVSHTSVPASGIALVRVPGVEDFEG